MGADSKIEWTTHTFNIAWGCVKSTPGCDNCYAETLAKRYGYGWGPGAPRRILSDAYWRQPLKWNADAERTGIRARVFCSSMTDVFLRDDTIDAEREKLWPLIRVTPWLDWQILTKHPERIAANLPADWDHGYENVWLGVSVENPEQYWRIERLRQIEAVVRFISAEPLLADLPFLPLDGIDWVIVGGESGPGARPMDLQWARNVVKACSTLGVAAHVKQLGRAFNRHSTDGAFRYDPKGGDWSRWPDDLRVREYPRSAASSWFHPPQADEPAGELPNASSGAA